MSFQRLVAAAMFTYTTPSAPLEADRAIARTLVVEGRTTALT